MKDASQVSETTACLICNGVASDGPTTTLDGCCNECAQLLRWFRGYFIHDPSFVATWRITPATTFSDLGAESLDWMCWVLEAEEKLGIDIPDKDAEKLYNVGQFVRYLRARGASWPSEYEIRLVQKGSCFPPRSYEWAKVHRHKKASEPGCTSFQIAAFESGLYDRELDG